MGDEHQAVPHGNYRNPSALCLSALGNPLERVKKSLIPTESCSGFAQPPLISELFIVPTSVSLCWQNFCVLWVVLTDGNNHVLLGLGIARTQCAPIWSQTLRTIYLYRNI